VEQEPAHRVRRHREAEDSELCPPPGRTAREPEDPQAGDQEREAGERVDRLRQRAVTEPLAVGAREPGYGREDALERQPTFFSGA
jgi:hypothetical protein